MRRLLPEEIPILPVIDIIAGESVAFGVGEPGIIIQFIDKDECVLLDWFDIISFGIEMLKANPVKQPEDAVEIEKPTEVI